MAIRVTNLGSIRRFARPRVTPRPLGGYNVASLPDPNEGLSQGRFDPSRDPGGAALTQRARQHRAQYEREREKENPFWRLTGGFYDKPLSAPWDTWSQALHEVGADRLRTGAAAGLDRPGYFDEPSTPPPGYTVESALPALQAFQAGGPPPDYLRNALPSTRSWARDALRGLQRAARRRS